MQRLIGTDIYIYSIADKSEIGLFDLAYDIEHPDQDLMQRLVDWLAVNCRDNFVVTKTITTIVAGGFSDNTSAGLKGLFNLSRKRGAHDFDNLFIYRIKLSSYDNVMFTMVWTDQSS